MIAFSSYRRGPRNFLLIWGVTVIAWRRLGGSLWGTFPRPPGRRSNREGVRDRSDRLGTAEERGLAILSGGTAERVSAGPPDRTHQRLASVRACAFVGLGRRGRPPCNSPPAGEGRLIDASRPACRRHRAPGLAWRNAWTASDVEPPVAFGELLSRRGDRAGYFLRALVTVSGISPGTMARRGQGPRLDAVVLRCGRGRGTVMSWVVSGKSFIIVKLRVGAFASWSAALIARFSSSREFGRWRRPSSGGLGSPCPCSRRPSSPSSRDVSRGRSGFREQFQLFI